MDDAGQGPAAGLDDRGRAANSDRDPHAGPARHGMAGSQGAPAAPVAHEAVRADLGKRPDDVSAMFDDVAPGYDRTNAIMSLGRDRHWRALVRRAVDARPGERLLDLAAGTGTSTVPLQGTGALAVAGDFSLGMMRVGRARHPDLPFSAADATRLPFADDSFDAVTISFGLRNVVDPVAGLREMLRVTRPGGRLVVCEFSHPTLPALRWVYDRWLLRMLPLLARASSHPRAYDYLAESILAWPAQDELAGRLEEAGWGQVTWRNATGGIVALHRGYRPVA